MQRAALLGASLGVVVAAAVARGQSTEWEFETLISVPYGNTLFLARDAADDVYATSFNSSSRSAEVVAFRITDAAGPQPEVRAFDRFLAPPSRGYSGIAVDDAGGVYVSADQGDGNPSFIRKFRKDLEPDPAFGYGGILATKQMRIQGLAAHGSYLVAAVSWARFLVLDTAGKYYGITPQPPADQSPMIRDIAVLPDRQSVIGIDRDDLYLFSGGGFAAPASYKVAQVHRGTDTRPAAGAAVGYAPREASVYFTLHARNELGAFDPATRTAGPVPAITAHSRVLQPADAVVSADGNTLWVSDLRASSIARFRHKGFLPPAAATVTPPTVAAREAGATAAASAPAQAMIELSPLGMAPVAAIPTGAPPTGLPIPPGEVTGPPELPADLAADMPVRVTAPPGTAFEWQKDLPAALQRASATGAKVVALFLTPESLRSREVERTIVESGLAKKYPKVVWVGVDVGRNPDAMQRHGFIKVPVTIVFSPDGAELRRFDGAIPTGELEAALK
jgi:DNA-binding beta-propeller fold protein YncE